MTSLRNAGCCCGACWEKGQCTPIYGEGFNMPAGYIRDKCCNCFPKRICVHLDLYEYGSEAVVKTVSVQIPFTCLSQVYTGRLQDEDIGIINFSIYYTKNSYTEQCFLAFESSILGYTGENLLIYPMGGDYIDIPTKRVECGEFNWQFNINIGESDLYLSNAVLRIEAADLMKIYRNCVDENLCLSEKACITYINEYGTIIEFQSCINEDGEWVVPFTDPETYENINLIIKVVGYDGYGDVLCGGNPTLELVTPINNISSEEIVEANCPDMAASWDFYDGRRILIKKNPRYKFAQFSDCKCICRCICVTRRDEALYATPPPKVLVGTACLDQLPIVGCGYRWNHGWSVTITNVEDNYDTQDINFWLTYDCESETTYMNCSLSDTAIPIVCPDIANLPGNGELTTIDWHIVPGVGQQPYMLSVKCLACQDCTAGTVSQWCCPYRELPAILHMEVTSTNPECSNLLGQIGTLVWNGDIFIPEWHGQLFSNEFILTCGGCPEGWCLSGCGPLILQGSGSCSPFLLSFADGAGCAACFDPVMGSYTITITE